MTFSYSPCMACGACCAYYRVSFYWGETTGLGLTGVPSELTEQVTSHLVAMKGTL